MSQSSSSWQGGDIMTKEEIALNLTLKVADINVIVPATSTKETERIQHVVNSLVDVYKTILAKLD